MRKFFAGFTESSSKKMSVKLTLELKKKINVVQGFL